jgi:hypothetical protein
MSKGSYDNIASKPAALRKVTTFLIGTMSASNFEELTGIPEEALTAAECARVNWAVEEISHRLHKLGGTE